MCIFPKIIKNPKYKGNKKNQGVIPYLTDDRVAYVPIGCGLCIECSKQRARTWKIRLYEDIKEHRNAKFITLTFSNESYHDLTKICIEKNKTLENYSLDNAVATIATRRFLERYRKKHKISVRHWLVTELGHKGTENIHLHGLIYTDDLNEIETAWSYGFIWKGKKRNGKYINYVSDRTINYITKYITKVDLLHKYYKPLILCSPGIGRAYKNSYNYQLNIFKGEKTKETYTNQQGFQMNLPVYYRNYIYSDEERELLWIQKLDKKVRYILGEKIDISKDENNYYNILKQAQEHNIKLGYGDPHNWSAIQYEKERRNLKQIERLEKLLKTDKNKNNNYI